MKKQILVSNVGKSIVFALALIFIFSAAAQANEAGIPTRLVISTINLDSQVVPVGLKEIEVEGVRGRQQLVDDNLVGWHNNSAGLGQAGNTILNGHSDIHAQVFGKLNQLEVGAEITVFSDNQTYNYVVTQLVLVKEKGVSLEQRLENARLIAPTADERLTLITCAQPGATHRLIVIAQPAPQAQ